MGLRFHGRQRFALPIILLTAFVSPASGTSWTLSGTIRDASTGEPLPAANVRILGASRGTIANDAGAYALAINSGRYSLIFSCLGYTSDTVQIQLDSSLFVDIRLTPAEILLPEIVVTAEDPAIAIIRRAIERKRLWFDRLLSYTFDAYTRQLVYRDTSIAGITESFTRGYWRQGDTLREVITQRRQTANIPSVFNLASVGHILNFNDDELSFAGYRFIGPTAQNALDYYDYKLLRTYTIRSHEVYEIRMIPRTRTIPLFYGTISIAGESYALAGVDVTPNEAFQLPFVKEKSLRYRQQFGIYDSLFWMPTDIRIDASVAISLVGLSIPRIGFHQTSAITDYAINTPIPDSVFGKARLVVDSTASRIDSSFWNSSTVLPLNIAEREAYRTLDSSKTFEVQFRPGGIAMSLSAGSDSSILSLALSWADISFNRVEGFHLGLEGELDSLSRTLSLNGGAAYAFSLHRWSYSLGAILFSSEQRTLGIGASIYRRIDYVPDQAYYSRGALGFAALFGKQDYRDYFSSRGWTIFMTALPTGTVHIKAGYVNEQQSTEIKRTDYSVLFPSHRYRANPAIQDGRLRGLTFWVRFGPPPVPLDLIARNSLELSFEHTSPAVLQSDFHFSRLSGNASMSLPTFGQRFLLPPTLTMWLSGGVSWGELVPQRLFNVESQLDGYAPPGVMRALQPRELTGTSMLAIIVEHNFRSLPFLALNIPFLYENNIELILHGGAARVWNKAIDTKGAPGIWYTEAGVGISRLFGIIRTDFTWRFDRQRSFLFTVGVAQIL